MQPPEMMPGAQTGIHRAARWQFEQRCKFLGEEELEADTAEHIRSATDAATLPTDLEAMFPALDASLVHALAAEALTPEHAIETLLALAAAMAEPAVQSGHEPREPTPLRDLGTDDLNKFPSLTDADEWELPSRRAFELDKNANDKSDWRDRAKDAADLPGHSLGPRKLVAARRKKMPKQTQREVTEDQCPDAYELRQQQGQRRALKQAQYGRRRQSQPYTEEQRESDESLEEPGEL